MRRLPFLFILIVSLSTFAFSPRVDFAQANFPGNCTRAGDSSMVRPDDVLVRYQHWGKQLVLVSLDTGDVVQVLESSFTTSDLANLDWSPDCHYLYGTANGDSIIWDALAGGRVATFASAMPKNPPYWNPGHDNLILEAYGGSYLWNFRTPAPPTLLDFSGTICAHSYLYFNWQVEWDNARDQVLVAPNYAGGSIVIAYDQSSAHQIAYFDNDCQQGPIKFTVTPDDRRLILFTAEDESFPGHSKAITVWDRDTMQPITVSANTQGAVLPTQVALSSDARYLVLARVGILRVWDLNDLASDVADRNPIHRYRIDANTRSVRFEDNGVVETTDFNNRVSQWNLLDGSKVSAPTASSLEKH